MEPFSRCCFTCLHNPTYDCTIIVRWHNSERLNIVMLLYAEQVYLAGRKKKSLNCCVRQTRREQVQYESRNKTAFETEQNEKADRDAS